MVNLPHKSLRVVYELVLSVPDVDICTAIRSLTSPDFNRTRTPSLRWYAIAHTYMTVPATNQGQHLYSHLLPANTVERHFRESAKVTQDIQSLVIYCDPATGARYQMAGDWIHGPLNAADEAARQSAEERFLHC